MKRMVMVALVSVLALVASACGGGVGGSTFSASQIHSFFDLYAFRIETQDTDRLTDMYHLPVKLSATNSTVEVTINSRTDLYDYADIRTYEGLGWTVDDVRLVVESVTGSGSSATAKISLIIDTTSPGDFEWRDIYEFEASLQRFNGEWKIVAEHISRSDFGER